MEKFSRTMRGYDPEEVNSFLDKVINQVETMVNEMNEKDKRIKELESFEIENNALKEKLLQYERMEGTLNKAIIMAQKTSEQIKVNLIIFLERMSFYENSCIYRNLSCSGHSL